MDGQFGALAFIATQSDVIERAEAQRALKLPEGTPLRECARARNTYTATRLAQDFKAGLRELARDAGDRDGGERLAAKHSLPVFTVSSVEYQKLCGLRPSDGPAHVWADVEDTQLPALIRHVQRQALVRRKALSTRRCEGMRDFAASLLSLLQHETRLPPAVRDAARAAFDAEATTLKTALEAHAKATEDRISAAFEEDITPKLQQGAATAKTAALETVQRWGAKNTEGGLHWATYKATTRRNGTWRINMNEALVEPIFKAVATEWERSFLSGLSNTLEALHRAIEASLADFHPALLRALQAAGVPPEASGALSGAQTDGLLTSLQSKVNDIKTAAQKQQRDLSRSMEPIVTTAMTPGYAAATAEAGTGSHRRRVAKLEGHVEEEAPNMFSRATESVVGQMDALSSGIGLTLRTDVVQAAQSAMRTAYSPLWDELGDGGLQARRALAPHVASALLEAKNAVRRLVEPPSSGSAAAGSAAAATGSAAARGGGGGDDDDDLVDVTEARRQAKRAKVAAETIDLDDAEGDPMEADGAFAAAAENAPPQSWNAGKVKAEEA